VRIPRQIWLLLVGAACLATAGCPSGCSELSNLLNPTGTSVQSVTVSPLATQLAVGQSLQFTATVLPTGVSDRSVAWAVAPSGLATIDANGLLTALAAGQAIVTATTAASPVHIAQSSLTITAATAK
jgi:uncharacterized protein YjdB